MQLKGLVYLIILLSYSVLFSQSNKEPTKNYTTAWAKTEISIDGKLDDEAWDQVDWGGDFVGFEPEYKATPSQKTQFKILYDAKFLYVGVRAFDTEPEKIVKRLSRRDGFDGDFVEINIDSYNDKRTAFSFSASVSGVKGDEYISNNGDDWDATWDPIWYLKTSIDEQGWIAEFKIPLSQLRFANQDIHTWGIQFTRRFFRKEERSTWQPINPTDPGWVHLFGELNGIKGIKAQKQLEIQPYVVASAQKYPKEEGNPFRDKGRATDANLGLDAKIGITSDITLDLTINPDFGQVEADPSAVNLSAFRLFFREQRPFFLEGSNVLSFRTSGGRNNLFYSRRVGGRPGGYPEREDIDYVDFPNQARILGAAKLTGKNAKGFSWGILESVTNRESAEVAYSDGTQGSEVVEPFTNFLVARAQQDINEGKTVIGAIVTNVHRFNNRGNGLEYLHDKAQSAGVDANHNFKNREYGINFKYVVSHVEGTQGAIYNTQTAPERFFQRTNNNHKQVDSTRTSLLGTATSLTFGKQSGNWRWRLGSNYRSPELALNDAGFLVQTDEINNWLWNSYRVTKPTKYFRSQNYNLYVEQNMDFGSVKTSSSANLNINLSLLNLWEVNTGLSVEGAQVSNADLRGGPSILYPGGINYRYRVGTNNQKKVRGSFNNWFYWGNEDFVKASGINASLTVRPTDALRVSLSPSVSWRRNDLQYIDQVTFNEVDQYLLAKVQQETYSLSMRANYNITPNLTLEFWGQPFLAKGEFSDFKKVNVPNSESYSERFILFTSDQVQYSSVNENYEVFESGSTDVDYTFSDPDFNIVQFRSNFVMRWEYIPGSTFFAVWSSNGSFSDQSDRNDFSDLRSELNNLRGTNTFLIKYTYRFIL